MCSAGPRTRTPAADAAQWEVPGQRFADLSDAGFGLTLFADCRHGYSARGGTLGVSLLRGPTYPDPVCDAGHHRFTLRLRPHAGGFDGRDAAAAAETLTRPLVRASARVAEALRGAVRVDGPVELSAVKLAEDRDAVIVRLYEPAGRSAEATVGLAAAATAVHASNGLEDLGEPLTPAADGSVPVRLRAFEIVTLSFELAAPP